jgi:hypothetical protein
MGDAGNAKISFRKTSRSMSEVRALLVQGSLHA